MSYKRKRPALTVYLEPWLKEMIRSRGESKGFALSSYIREVIKEDLGIPSDFSPKEIEIQELENGVTRYSLVHVDGEDDE